MCKSLWKLCKWSLWQNKQIWNFPIPVWKPEKKQKTEDSLSWDYFFPIYTPPFIFLLFIFVSNFIMFQTKKESDWVLGTKNVFRSFRKENYKSRNSSSSSELYPFSNLMDSSWQLVWTWINGRILPSQWNSVTVLLWRFFFPVPSLKGLSMHFFFQYEEFLWLQPSGSFSQGSLLHTLWELPVIAQTWQRIICRFSLFLWKFLLYGLFELQKSLSWESVS